MLVFLTFPLIANILKHFICIFFCNRNCKLQALYVDKGPCSYSCLKRSCKHDLCSLKRKTCNIMYEGNWACSFYCWLVLVDHICCKDESDFGIPFQILGYP